MDLQKLCGALRRGSMDAHRCLGCAYEHDCSVHGCQIMKQAADMLEDLQKQVVQAKSENQAIFRLGQLDVKEGVIDMLRDAADVLPSGSTVGATLLAAADLVKDMEVGHGYRKVGFLEQLCYVLRWKLSRIFRRKNYVYDFYLLTEYEDLRSVLRMINEQGWQLVCVAPYEGDLAVFFRRPAP